jgi:xylulokinase
MNHADLVIGIDASTTGCKAIAWNPSGESIAVGRCRLEIIHPKPDWHEQKAEGWWQALVTAVQQVTSQVDAKRIATACITHQRETFVPVDESGKPLRNGILWMDERTRNLLPRLREQFGAERFHQITGKPLSGNLTIGKIAWLQAHEPKIVEQAEHFLDVHAFLVKRLTGKYRTGWGCADPMGLFDMQRNRWAEELLIELGVHAGRFPEACPPGTILGEINQEAAEECGLIPGTPLVAGLGDGQSAGLGANITRQDEAYLSMGTSFISGVFGEQYVVNPAFRTLYAGIPGGYFIETAILGGSYIVRWFVEKFVESESIKGTKGISPEERYAALASEITPGSHGLLLVPYWNSAMGPYWDANASGIIVGWRGAHSPAHLYRAILEGIAFEQYLNTRGVEAALGTPTRRYVATGGGSQNGLWRQIIADVTGIPVYRATTQECAALGAGILAASAAGWYENVRQAAQAMAHVETQVCEPDGDRHRFYRQLFEEVYVHLFPALQHSLTRLTELTSTYEENHPTQ